MKYWNEYTGHIPEIVGKRNKYDNTIYTFDIETTSYITLYGKQKSTIEYLEMTKEEKEKSNFCACMYIWMFGINDTIYYGRTWTELDSFLNRIEYYATSYSKIVYVHNLSFEFQFLRNVFLMKNVLARKSHKVMKCELEKYNFEFRCTYYMTNAPLKKLPEIYGLEVEKMVGDLDYTKIRHSKTKLTEKELKYCENDCLVLYEYIKTELKTYETCKKTPLTSTGHVRKELKDNIRKDYEYRNKVRKSINTDGHIYNLLLKCFQGRIYTCQLVIY